MLKNTNLHADKPCLITGQSFQLPEKLVQDLIDNALREDFGRMGDITSQSVIPEDAIATVVMAAREDGVIAGLRIAEQTFKTLDRDLDITLHIADGETVTAGTELMTVSGNARAILMAERVALNFAGRLSGVASKTAEMVQAAGAHKATICSTRKTTPGLRMVEKYAVRMGGGMNHRLGLDDAVLIKDNHIAIAGGIVPALESAKQNVGHMVKIEIEVDTLAQLEDVIATGIADVVMLDNMNCDDLRTAVNMIDGRLLAEASGGVTLKTVADIAATGVDLISVGALTHSVTCLDIGLDFKA